MGEPPPPELLGYGLSGYIFLEVELGKPRPATGVAGAFRPKCQETCISCYKTPGPRMTFNQKILVSVKFVSAILGPEMGAPILWTPGKMRSFCRKNHVRKITLFWGGFFGGGGGECRFYFYGRADFSDLSPGKPHASSVSTPS